MKKSILTNRDIQRNLLSILHKRKVVAIYLTAFLSVLVLLYIYYTILYVNEIYLPQRNLTFLTPTMVMIITPFIIVFLAGFLFHYYYSKLYEIKNGRFVIIKEKLYQKEREMKRYYRHTEKENAFYFSYGRIAVEDAVYSYSNIGDYFYLVMLKSSKTPFFVYHTKYYDIEGIL